MDKVMTLFPMQGIRDDLLEVTGTGVRVPQAEEAGQAWDKPRAASRSGWRRPKVKGPSREQRGPDPWVGRGTLGHHGHHAKGHGELLERSTREQHGPIPVSRPPLRAVWAAGQRRWD